MGVLSAMLRIWHRITLSAGAGRTTGQDPPKPLHRNTGCMGGRCCQKASRHTSPVRRTRTRIAICRAGQRLSMRAEDGERSQRAWKGRCGRVGVGNVPPNWTAPSRRRKATLRKQAPKRRNRQRRNRRHLLYRKPDGANMSGGGGCQPVLFEIESSSRFRPPPRRQCMRCCRNGTSRRRQSVDKRRWHEGRGRESPRRSEFPTNRELG